jgi:pyridoxamine 5'-phosphate oxidase
MSTKTMRVEYLKGQLVETEVSHDPFVQFKLWFDAAISEQAPEPNAMTLSTVTPEGRPSSRIVLLKEFDSRGFAFFTNRQSRKGQELAANPFASLVFFWPSLERQVRIEGHVLDVSDAEADAYFAMRPPSARLGACASEQSQVVPDRATLERALADLERLHPDGEVARPAHWGGYRVIPNLFEFWQGRHSRLHDRLRYLPDTTGWKIDRLSP